MQEGSGIETPNVTSVLYLFAVKNKDGIETGLRFYHISKMKFYTQDLCIYSKGLYKKNAILENRT